MATLKELRINGFLSQGDLAKKVKMSRESICRFENGREKPSIRAVAALAKALKVNPKEIEFLPGAVEDSLQLAGEGDLSQKARVESFVRTLNKAIRETLQDIPEQVTCQILGNRTISDQILQVQYETNKN